MDCVDLVLVLGLGLGLILYCKIWHPLALPYMCPLPIQPSLLVTTHNLHTAHTIGKEAL